MATRQEINDLNITIKKLFEEGNYIEAKLNLDNLIKLEPDQGEYYFLVAECNRMLIKPKCGSNDSLYSDALKYYEIAIHKASNDIDKAQYYAGRAELHSVNRLQQAKQEAVKDLDTAIFFDPNIRYYERQAKLAAQLQMTQLAYHNYQILCTMQPDNKFYQQQANIFKPNFLNASDRQTQLNQHLKSLQEQYRWATVKTVAWGFITAAVFLVTYVSVAAMLLFINLVPALMLGFAFFGTLSFISLTQTLSSNEHRDQLSIDINKCENELSDILVKSVPAHKETISANLKQVGQQAVNQQTLTNPYPATGSNATLKFFSPSGTSANNSSIVGQQAKTRSVTPMSPAPF